MADNTAERVLELAMNEVGEEDGGKYIAFYNELTGIGLPANAAWCAAWVTYIMRRAGVPTESVLNFKGCATASEWFAERGRFKTRKSGYVPLPGDIIMYEWSPEDEYTECDDGDDHTGIVEKTENGLVYTIEGNNNGMCRRTRRSLGDKYISGYCIPIYNVRGADDMLSYEDFVKYMRRYEREKAERPVSEWAEGAVKYCRENGIMNGDDDGEFRPQSAVTRQEVAQVIYNLRG